MTVSNNFLYIFWEIHIKNINISKEGNFMKKKFQKIICFLLALIVCTGSIGTENVLAATTSTASKICSRHGGVYDSYIKNVK